MYNIERLKADFIEACELANVEFDNIPIEMNGRLTRTLGRVHWTRSNGDITPIKVDFSKHFIENSTDECIRSVVFHEAAHYIAIKRTNEDHGHDNVFKGICKEIGYEEMGSTHTKVESLRSAKSYHKYDIICPHCGQVVGGRQRKCQLVNNPDMYYCPECGKLGLEVKQNW